MKKLKNTEGKLLQRLYYDGNPNASSKINFKQRSSVYKDYNTKINELDRSLNVKSILKEINKTAVIKEKKDRLKSILKKHYFSQEKIKIIF